MKVTVMNEAGSSEALFGLSLSYNSSPSKTVANKLAFKGDGHNKFLEMIAVWLDITAPRYWWSQFDTYRIGVTKQSESTMHTLMERAQTQSDFEGKLDPFVLRVLNNYIARKDLEGAKTHLPESFLQRRVVKTNYMTLQRIIRQRRTHKLVEWHEFCDAIIQQCEWPELLEEQDDS